jgi:hypothetical protein
MKRPSLVDHPALLPLMPLLQSSSSKGLTAILSGEREFCGTAEEVYAGNVAERVSELDNALESLRLSLNYIMDLATGPEPSPAQYRYHYENFLFRAVGLVDRAHRFVGASLLLDAEKYDSNSGNKYVITKVRETQPEVAAALDNVVTCASKHKAVRNELIHSTAFSSRELGLFGAFEKLSLPTPEGIDLQGLMREHFSFSAGDIAVFIAEAEGLLQVLIETLKPVYARVRADA